MDAYSVRQVGSRLNHLIPLQMSQCRPNLAIRIGPVRGLWCFPKPQLGPLASGLFLFSALISESYYFHGSADVRRTDHI